MEQVEEYVCIHKFFLSSYTHTCVYMCVCACEYVYIYACILTYIDNIYTYKYIIFDYCMYACMYACMKHVYIMIS